MAFTFRRLEIPELILVEARGLEDGRGFFAELYKRSVFAANGIEDEFVQDNHSRSVQGTLRGLHYQLQPQAQAKLVVVLRGRIFDVAVDIRRGSPSYGRWLGIDLDAGAGEMLYLPPGFAHGFCVVSDEADVLYKVTAEYAPELERGIIWNDADIGIRWPLTAPRLSARDAALPSLQETDNNFDYEAGA
ncbi:MAG: dTDP-4-dehydrorhamnose 3,5-epimerase [Acidobacteriota bacterium]